MCKIFHLYKSIYFIYFAKGAKNCLNLFEMFYDRNNSSFSFFFSLIEQLPFLKDTLEFVVLSFLAKHLYREQSNVFGLLRRAEEKELALELQTYLNSFL